MKSLACYFFAASTWWHVGWRRQHLSFWVFTIFHYERSSHAPSHMAFYMAVHEPHSCNRENIPTLHLTYCNIKKNNFLDMQVGSFKGLFLFLFLFFNKGHECLQHTRVGGLESDCNPTILRNRDGILMGRIHQIVAHRIPIFIEIPKSPSNNIETMSMEMHGVGCPSNQVCPLKNNLHCGVILEHPYFCSGAR